MKVFHIMIWMPQTTSAVFETHINDTKPIILIACTNNMIMLNVYDASKIYCHKLFPVQLGEGS